MNIPTIKEMVKDQKKTIFIYYRDGELWYKTECGFEFPVPIKDVGNATFLAEDKAILLMRYIRKHKEMLESTEKEQRHGSRL
jgi:hypothetical protein